MAKVRAQFNFTATLKGIGQSTDAILIRIHACIDKVLAELFRIQSTV
jgi:hypothetical protein